MVQFQIEEYHFETLHFQRLADNTPESGNRVDAEQRLRIQGGVDGNALLVRLSLEIGQEGIPFIVQAVVQGKFVLNEVPDTEALDSIVHINCAGILFPFVREAVAELTRKGGFPPVLVPPVNFVELFRNRKQAAAENDGGEPSANP